MFSRNESKQFYLYAHPVDFRGSIDSFTNHVSSLLMKEPQSGDVYIFYNRNKDKLKALFWDHNGFVLYYKRMERRKFMIGKLLTGEINLSSEECQLLLAGFDFTVKRDYKDVDFSRYF